MEEELSLEQRVARLEALVSELAGKAGQNGSAASPAPAPRSERRDDRSNPEVARAAARPNPFASRSLEWWLARGGAILTSLALILLYQYAVEKNWITPVVRVVAGVAVGAALLYCARRFTSRTSLSPDSIGLRETLLGAGLAAWYITAYAAAIFYSLIPVSAARLLFLALTILGAWLALSEHRSLLGLLALGVGFLTPVLLPSEAPNIPVLALYLAALTGVGLLLYLMRGWLSILWLTFIAFWWTVGEATNVLHTEGDRFAISILAILAGAAMVRTPLLRRGLVASGSPLYTEPRRSEHTESSLRGLSSLINQFSGTTAAVDSPALWVITILSPLLSVLVLSWSWTAVQGSVWGIASLAIAAVIYRLAASSNSDQEFTHVEAAAAAAWSLAGTLWVADSAGSRFGESGAFVLFAASFHALVTVYYLRDSVFAGARKVGFMTAATCLFSVILWEVGTKATRPLGFEPMWTIAEIATIASAVWIWWSYRKPADPFAFSSLFGIAAYIATLLVDSRILGQIWPPLVTASFAVIGAALLISGRSREEAATLRKLGGATLALVVFRLFFVDLAGVETIWRVLLFMGVGALFLFTSHRLQRVPTRQ
jgi:uncharacterized membrane protein